VSPHPWHADVRTEAERLDVGDLVMLATTDDPCDDLSVHIALDADPTWKGRVVPTFRPDAYLEPVQPGWAERVWRLGETAGVDTGSQIRLTGEGEAGYRGGPVPGAGRRGSRTRPRSARPPPPSRPGPGRSPRGHRPRSSTT